MRSAAARLPLLVLVAVVAFAVAAPGAFAHAGHLHPEAATHGDPRAALPDSLVTEAVAESELPPFGTRSLGSRSTAPTTWCGTERTSDDTAAAVYPSSTPQLKMIYAYASGQPNRFAQLRDKLQANVSLFGRYFAAQSGGRKSLRWDMGTDCGPEFVDIVTVALPGTRDHYVPNGAPSFSRVEADIRAALPVETTTGRNWTVYADGMFGTNGVAGTASRYYDDKINGPANNMGKLVNVTFGPQTVPSGAYAWPGVMLHEIAHNLGAVQDSAPNTTQGGHCFDRFDLMCYPDGAPKGQWANMVERCPAGTGDFGADETLDCGGDDYFNPTPASGSYLDTHWNMYSSVFLGTCSGDVASQCGLSGDGPDVTAPANTTPTPGSGWRRSAYEVTLSGTDAVAAVDAWQWKIGSAGAVQSTREATVPAVDGETTLFTRVRDANLNWSSWRADTLRFDTVAPTVDFSCTSGWATTGSPSCSFGGSDSRSGVVKAEMQRGAAASWTTMHSGGPWTSFSGAVAYLSVDGDQVWSGRVTDAAGNVATSSSPIRRDTVNPVLDVSCPSTWQAESATCTVAASDATSGVEETTWKVGSGAAEPVAGGELVVSSPGVQTVSVTTTDVAGRSTTRTATVRVDDTAPVVSVSCPSEWRASGSCSVSATDPESGVASRAARVDGGAAVDAGSGVASSAHGVHAVEGRAVNAAGMTSGWSDAASLRIDTVAPSASLTCASGWQASAFTCPAGGADADSGVARVEHRLDGGTVSSTSGSSADVAVSAAGTHTVEARTVDAAGNASAWQSATARLDLTDPTATLSCPAGWAAGSASCTVTSGDTGGSGVASTAWRLDGGDERTGAVEVDEPGEHTVSLRVTDGSGRATTRTATVRVDDTPPVVELDCPAGWRTAAFDCTVTASDAQSGVASRAASVDGAAFSGLAGTTRRISAEGAHTVTARATNGAGVTATSGAVEAKLDLTNPVVTVSCSVVAPGSHACTATATDATSGLSGPLRGVVGTGEPFDVIAGEAFAVTGPAQLTVSAADAATRKGSKSVTLAGADPAPQPPKPQPDPKPLPQPEPKPGPQPPAPVAPPAITPTTPTTPPNAPRVAPPAPPAPVTATTTLKGLGGGSVLVEVLGGRPQATAALQPKKLKKGTWRLEVCIAGRCTRRTVKLRRAGRPKPLIARVATGDGPVRVTFTVSRKVGRTFKRQARSSTSAQLL